MNEASVKKHLLLIRILSVLITILFFVIGLLSIVMMFFVNDPDAPKAGFITGPLLLLFAVPGILSLIMRKKKVTYLYLKIQGFSLLMFTILFPFSLPAGLLFIMIPLLFSFCGIWFLTVLFHREVLRYI